MSETPYLLAAIDPAWRDDTDYDAGALKYHGGKIYKALQASGPHRGGVRRPDTSADYWVELAEIGDTRLVHTSGDETIAGTKTFSRSIYMDGTGSQGLYKFFPSVTKGTPPSDTVYAAFLGMDANGQGNTSEQTKRLFMLEMGLSPQSTSACIYAYKNEADVTSRGELGVFYPNDGEPYAVAPSTPDNATKNKIVTVDYLAKNNGLVHTTGDETIAGHKVFTNTVSVPADFTIIGGSDKSPDVDCKLTGYNLGDELEDPSSFRSWHALYSSDNKEVGRFAVRLVNNSLTTAELKCSRPIKENHGVDVGVLAVFTPATGDPYATAPNTRETPQDNEIVTVDYLKKYVADALAAQQKTQTTANE